ncbi:MAG TPA: hypothetical protein VES93_01910 [Ornithinibacter sp.]|nr:hypothetical protein [Ornithinibacter sp.]
MSALRGNDPFVVACLVIICVCAAMLAIVIASLRAKPGLRESSPDAPLDGSADRTKQAVDHP